ncbi:MULTISPECIES: YcaO-like family protein [unclassified Achromobacter]|uniref:YcaO-like family protein n=1 Tax=unclassified Achromobacter TaxID=2626865 RepID=UPI000B519D33|nr:MULTISPECIES: YcaO-like family protein [unclassified Achromobacter]OWT74551.1 hypothetical protein CEY05_18270 [Achromobacter sp. HZ34]OWT79018.1 hypothetical protein CEY04_08190 [Achromobacter sp. HZ28]
MYAQRKFPRSTVDHPTYFIRESTINLHIPGVCWSADDYSLGASGVGKGHSALKAGIGEFFERRHFCTAVSVDRYGRLTDLMDDDESAEWVTALQQTGDAESEKIKSHIFALTKVIDLRTDEPKYVPTCTIRIHPIHGRKTDDFFRFHDTSGCAAHTDAQEVIAGSMKEQIERQSLLLFWLTGSCGLVVSREIVIEALKAYEVLHRKLERQGVLEILDITLPGCPGYAILIVYRGVQKSAAIQYCPGLSFALDLPSAIRKAFKELWQNFNFLIAMNSRGSSPSSVSDRYTLHFLRSNTFEVAEDVCRKTGLTIYQRRPVKAYGASDLAAYIQRVFPISYLYLNSAAIGTIPVYFCKLLSPGMFLNMDNSQCNNIENRVTKPYAEIIRPDRMSRMVPFP